MTYLVVGMLTEGQKYRYKGTSAKTSSPDYTSPDYNKTTGQYS